MPNERAKQIPAYGTRSTSVPSWRNVEEFHRELAVLTYLSRAYLRLEQQLERGIAPSFVRSCAPSHAHFGVQECDVVSSVLSPKYLLFRG
jgi:hypothetical protein